MAIQKLLVTVLNRIYGATAGKMRRGRRELCLWLIFVLFSVYFIMLFSKSFNEGFLSTNNQREILFSVLILAASVFSMEGEVSPVEFNKRVSVTLLLCSLGLILTGLLHNTGDGYLLFGFMLLLIYPCFYIVWNNRRDYEKLFDLIAGANVLVGSIYAMYNFKKGANRYLTRFFAFRFKGTTWNSNLYSMIGLTLFCCSLYFVYKYRKDVKKLILFSITMLMGLTVVLLGKSRAAILIVIITVMAAVFYGVKEKIKVNTANWKRIVLIGAMLILILMCIGFLSGKGSSGEQADGGSSAISDRFSVKGKDLNEYTTGRIDLWNVYVPMLNMLGNDVDEINWDELPVTKSAHCHNNFLEYGYRCGVPVSLLFCALELIACLFALVYMLSRDCRRESLLFVIIMMAMYFIDSLIDIATLPVERYAPFFFYLVLTVMLDPKPNAAAHKEKARVIYKDQNNQ